VALGAAQRFLSEIRSFVSRHNPATRADEGRRPIAPRGTMLHRSKRGVFETIVTTAEMLGKCVRLRAELSRAYQATPRNIGYIRRLAADIQAIERTITALQQVVSAPEGCGDAADVASVDDHVQLARPPHAAASDAERLLDAA
jgi:hypothetical protein